MDLIPARKAKVLVEILHTLKKENFYWTIGFYALMAAGLTHMSFIFLFIYLDIYPLVLLNIFSTFIYFYAIFGLGLKTIKTKNDGIIGWMVYFELIIHGVVSTYYLGLVSGFKYYIYTLVFLPFFTSSYTAFIRFIRITIVILVAILLEIWGKQNQSHILLDENILYVLHMGNLFIFLFIMGVLSHMYVRSSEEDNHKLLNQNNLDYLTKLYNRRYVIRASEKRVNQFQEKGTSFAVLMLDIDYFKDINDTYGHVCGDNVLIHLSKLLKESLRAPAIVSRWGGEEFLILLSDIDIQDLKSTAERLRISIEESTLYCTDKSIHVTVTLGGTISQKDEDFNTLLIRADKALYQGKESGRNQVCII